MPGLWSGKSKDYSRYKLIEEEIYIKVTVEWPLRS